MIDVFPDCVFPSIQKTGAGVLTSSSARVASRSGGGPSLEETTRRNARHTRLILLLRGIGLGGTGILACAPQKTAKGVPPSLPLTRRYFGYSRVSGGESPPLSIIPCPTISRTRARSPHGIPSAVERSFAVAE